MTKNGNFVKSFNTLTSTGSRCTNPSGPIFESGFTEFFRLMLIKYFERMLYKCHCKNFEFNTEFEKSFLERINKKSNRIKTQFTTELYSDTMKNI